METIRNFMIWITWPFWLLVSGRLTPLLCVVIQLLYFYNIKIVLFALFVCLVSESYHLRKDGKGN